MPRKQQQTLFQMLMGASQPSPKSSTKKQDKNAEAESASSNKSIGKKTPAAQPHAKPTAHCTSGNVKCSSLQQNNLSTNVEMSPKRKRRRADPLFSDDEANTSSLASALYPHAKRAVKARRTEKSTKVQNPSPTATAAAEAHPYRRQSPFCDIDMKDSIKVSSTGSKSRKPGQGVHTPSPSRYNVLSQHSIDTPPPGVSRVPSQDGGQANYETIRAEYDEFCQALNTLDGISGNDMTDDSVLLNGGATLLRQDEDIFATTGEEDRSSGSIDVPTPKPIPRNSVPASFKLCSSRTPMPKPKEHRVNNTNINGKNAGVDLSDDSQCYIPLESLDSVDREISLHHTMHLCDDTQERPTQHTQPNMKQRQLSKGLIDDVSILEGNKETEGCCDLSVVSSSQSSKHRHTMDLGAFFTQGGLPVQEPKSKARQQKLNFGEKRRSLDKRKDELDLTTLPNEIDPIEKTTQTDDEVEKVEAGTSRALQLLQAGAKAQQQQAQHHISTSGTSGSLFALSGVTLTSQGSSDLASPMFDPSRFQASEVVQAIKNNEITLKFSLIASMLDQIESLKGSGAGSKKKVTILLTNLFRLLLWLSPKDFIPLIYFCLNKVGPDYEGLETGVGEAMLIKIMGDVYSRSEQSIKSDLKRYEDLGCVAESSRSSMNQLFKPQPLSIQSVFNSLKFLPLVSGKNSQEQKRQIIKKLLAAAEKSESKYIIRFLQGKMRVGVQSATVFQALAYAFVLTSAQSSPFGSSSRSPASDYRRHSKKRISAGVCKMLRKIESLSGVAISDTEMLLTTMEAAVKKALSEVSNIEVVTQYLFEGCDATDLATKCVVTPGIPVQPMLARPTKGLQEVLTRFSDCEFTCEFKYDGERAQIHLTKDKKIVVFSRNLENLTEKYPDVINAAREAFEKDVTECILDSEVVAYDSVTQKIQSFQILSTRKRKAVEADRVTVQVCVFVFDCIQFNGKSLTKHTLEERRRYLQQCIHEVPNKFMFAKHSEMVALEEIDSFLREAIDANCEGLMVKTLNTNASYEPSKRSLNWLKIKKDYLEHLTDSVDLVPIGAYLGTGKRAKWYGTYLLACYNSDEEIYQTVCKVGTGYTDENLQELYEFFKTKVTSTKDASYQVEDKMVRHHKAPDVWFEACTVWEVRAADLSLSPVHTAAIGLKHPTKGIGLRFPRFIRVRDDKNPEQATTNIQIAEMYENQFIGANSRSLLKDEKEDNDDDAE